MRDLTMVGTERKTNMEKTLLTLTAALGLTISVISTKANQGYQTDSYGRNVFMWATENIDDRNGYYTHTLVISPTIDYLHLSYVSCDQMGGDPGAWNAFCGWTFSYTTTNPQCQWHWTYDIQVPYATTRNVDPGDVLKIRSGPGTRFSVVAAIPAGASDISTFEAKQVWDGDTWWVPVQWHGFRGYVGKSHLSEL